MRRLLSFAAFGVIVVVLAGCGGGGSSKKSASTPAAQVRTDWTEFFNGSTPMAKRVSLLQDGQRYEPVIAAQSKSPLAQESKAQVSNVTLSSPGVANVRYTILLAGKPVLKNQTGTAVKSGGTWKVSDASFCRLLALQGKPPPGCPTS